MRYLVIKSINGTSEACIVNAESPQDAVCNTERKNNVLEHVPLESIRDIPGGYDYAVFDDRGGYKFFTEDEVRVFLGDAEPNPEPPKEERNIPDHSEVTELREQQGVKVTIRPDKDWWINHPQFFEDIIVPSPTRTLDLEREHLLVIDYHGVELHGNLATIHPKGWMLVIPEIDSKWISQFQGQFRIYGEQLWNEYMKERRSEGGFGNGRDHGFGDMG